MKTSDIKVTVKKQETQDRYWMVHQMDGQSPYRQHKTKESATTEARRLATQFAGKTYTVLEVVECYRAAIPEVVSVPVEPVHIQPVVRECPRCHGKNVEMGWSAKDFMLYYNRCCCGNCNFQWDDVLEKGNEK